MANIRHWIQAAGKRLRHLLALPGAAASYAAGKWKAHKEEDGMAASARLPKLSPAAASRLKDAWLKLEAGAAASTGQGQAFTPPAEGEAASSAAAGAGWSADELMLIRRIRAETEEANRNNVTRTEAYRNVYFRLPELHWALLAHLVSRNGGWNMTDLQGEWLPRLLTERQRSVTFQFLERANWLIFQDAYPQLLLYQWSLRQGRSLFHLLPAFGVSAFMKPVWRLFWRERDSAMLTTALIVNEQHYIEERVVRHPYFREHVTDTMFFGLQSLMQLNGVVFPYGSGREGAENELKLAGLIMERFQNLEERIEFGKRLYAVLFGIPEVYEGAKCFAAAVKHTGSRADYAPHLFEAVRAHPPQRPYEEKLLGGRLKPGASRIFSPPLSSAWPDSKAEPAEPGDWFRSARQVTDYFRDLPLPPHFEMTNEYGLMLNKLELAVLASQRGAGGNGVSENGGRGNGNSDG